MCPKAPKHTAKSNSFVNGISMTSPWTKSMLARPGAPAVRNFASSSIPWLKSIPVRRCLQSGRSQRIAAPVPQQISSAELIEDSLPRYGITRCNTLSGVRKGVLSKRGASRSYPVRVELSACCVSSQSVGPSR